MGTNEERDGYWKELGLAAPARRALVNAKMYSLKDLKKITLENLKALHGMGPSALSVLTKEMKKAGVNFRK